MCCCNPLREDLLGGYAGDPAGILSTYSDSLQTLAVTLAVERSLATAQPVSPTQLLLQACN